MAVDLELSITSEKKKNVTRYVRAGVGEKIVSIANLVLIKSLISFATLLESC